MPGKHRGATVLGPKFIRQPVRHVNRNDAGNRTSVMGSTLLLVPEDTEYEQPERPPGRHRLRADA